MKSNLAPYVTFSLARAGQFASEQEAQAARDICAESLIWAKLISRVHNGECNPFARVGKWLYSLIPMHACQQKPMDWSQVFVSR